MTSLFMILSIWTPCFIIMIVANWYKSRHGDTVGSNIASKQEFKQKSCDLDHSCVKFDDSMSLFDINLYNDETLFIDHDDHCFDQLSTYIWPRSFFKTKKCFFLITLHHFVSLTAADRDHRRLLSYHLGLRCV